MIQGIVPDDLKSARVVPIFKKNCKTEVGNNCPVSILIIISRVFEIVVYDQLEIYLDKRKLLYDVQSGFLPKYSTGTCLIHLTDFIKFQMDKGNAVGMVLLDIRRPLAQLTIPFYLLNWKPLALVMVPVIFVFFDVAGTFSSCENITCGVPQGSIVGPLLFLIYVNDMSGVIGKTLFYSDDSAILVADKDISTVQNALQTDLQIVSEWLIDDKLSLHLDKT